MRSPIRRIAVLALLLAPTLAVAQNPDGEKEAVRRTPAMEAAEAVSLAAALAAYGRRNEAPQALLAAASILLDHAAPLRPLAGGDSLAGPPLPPLDAAVLIAEAEQFIGDDVALQQQAAALRARPAPAPPPPTRGAEDGPVRYATAAEGRGQQRLTLPFRGRETATIHLIGDGASDLDYYLYDVNGDLVASDEGPSDSATLFWYVPYRQELTLRVRNRGPRRNAYHIVIN